MLFFFHITFQKRLTRMWHEGLIKKLKSYGISGNLLISFKNYSLMVIILYINYVRVFFSITFQKLFTGGWLFMKLKSYGISGDLLISFDFFV